MINKEIIVNHYREGWNNGNRKTNDGIKTGPGAKFKELQGQAMANEKITNAREIVLEWETKDKDLIYNTKAKEIIYFLGDILLRLLGRFSFSDLDEDYF